MEEFIPDEEFESALEEIREKGWVEIKSSILDENFYLVGSVKKSKWTPPSHPPNKDLAKYNLDEIETLKGHNKDASEKNFRFAHGIKTIFGGVFEDVSPETLRKREEYFARKEIYFHQKTMAEKGTDARWDALAKLEKKVDTEITSQMIREATYRNIARTKKAQAIRKAEKAARKENNEYHERKAS